MVKASEETLKPTKQEKEDATPKEENATEQEHPKEPVQQSSDSAVDTNKSGVL